MNSDTPKTKLRPCIRPTGPAGAFRIDVAGAPLFPQRFHRCRDAVTPILNRICTTKILATFLLGLLAVTLCPSVLAQGTAFTYEGRFNANGTPYTGSADFQFTLWDAGAAGAQVAANNPAIVAVSVTDGLFTVTLDFGAAPFSAGADRWLQLEARTTPGPFTTLSPRQKVTATPYAITAGNLTGLLPGTSLSGAYPGAVTLNNAGNSFNGTFTGSGAGLTTLNASQLTSGTVPDARLSSAVARVSQSWQLDGNGPGGIIVPALGPRLGTTANQALNIIVNDQRALRIDPASHNDYGSCPNLIGGYQNNSVGNGIVGAVICGGGGDGLGDALANRNRVNGHFATVVGGSRNTASGPFSTAMGFNTTASGFRSTAMGYDTIASGESSTAMGFDTKASGFYSTAMGSHANALHNDSFVWADGTAAEFNSTAASQFSIRARGGLRLSDDTALNFGNNTAQKINLHSTQHGIGVQASTTYFRSSSRFSWYRDGVHSDTQNSAGTGGTVLMTLTGGGLTVNGTFVSSSDRNVKERFEPVNARDVLEKVAALPLSRWNYKDDPSQKHIGPMAQDFHAAFTVGPDDRHIATVDADGVALAAIQGLNQKLEETRAENAELKQRLAKLEQLMNRGEGGAR